LNEWWTIVVVDSMLGRREAVSEVGFMRSFESSSILVLEVERRFDRRLLRMQRAMVDTMPILEIKLLDV
jgi:hypothetical protein